MLPNDTTQPAGEEAQSAPAGVPELSALAEEMTKIPIEAIDHDFLIRQSNKQLEEFLNYLYVCGLTLKSKGEIAHAILEFRGKCLDKARRLRALPADESALILGACTPEEADEIAKAMTELAKGPAEADKPATQNLMGSHITRDVAQEVNPGGSAQAPAAPPASETPAT
jgi:hypothetical protein